MRIKIIKTTVEAQSKGKANWNKLNVVFTNLGTDKVDGRNIMSFNKEVYGALQNAQRGEIYELDEAKNERGYDEVVKVIKLDSEVAAGQTVSGNVQQATAAPARTGNWETAEERAKKQDYIVRQSSVTSALEYFKSAGIKPKSLDDVFAVAESIRSFVFQVKDEVDPLKTIADMQNDIPEAK